MRHIRQGLPYSAAVGVLLALAACNGDDEGTETAATFTEIRDGMLLPSCGFSSCHGSGAGGLTLDEAGSYAALVDAASVGAPGEIHVVPGDADGSYLVIKLEGGAGIVGDAMPPPSGGLDPADVTAIREWIVAGALDN